MLSQWSRRRIPLPLCPYFVAAAITIKLHLLDPFLLETVASDPLPWSYCIIYHHYQARLFLPSLASLQQFQPSFDVSYKPRFPILGHHGIDLRAKWAQHPDSYMGISVPSFPNYLFSSGPYWPVANGSLIGASNASAMYAVAVIHKLQLQPNNQVAGAEAVRDGRVRGALSGVVLGHGVE
jgi:hypothetical protein